MTYAEKGGIMPILNFCLRYIYCALFLFSFISCTTAIPVKPYKPLYNQNRLPKPDVDLKIPALKSCTYSKDNSISLNSNYPVTVIVHGCFSSAGKFRSLADVFAFHGQQAVCFEYNDRDSLEKSSGELAASLSILKKKIGSRRISVIAHSQGGLIARRALIEERENSIKAKDSEIELITISAPFGGIEASSHCGSKALALLSLGITKVICRIITGDKYKEIPPNSAFIQYPGKLISAVYRHIKIVTNESGTCRRFDSNQLCVEDDYVFSIDEQKQRRVDDEERTQEIVTDAGHVEIVGDEDVAPVKLITILQEKGVLNKTDVVDANSFERLLARLY